LFFEQNVDLRDEIDGKLRRLLGLIRDAEAGAPQQGAAARGAEDAPSTAERSSAGRGGSPRPPRSASPAARP
jgi:hypothetical protein